MAKQRKQSADAVCAGCGVSDRETKQTAIYPQWLLSKTKTFSKPVHGVTAHKTMAGRQCTAALCEECRTVFAKELDEPAVAILKQIENGTGFNDQEADILIRWLWKVTGLAAALGNGMPAENLRERCAKPLESPRSRMSIAAALTNGEFNDRNGKTAMGITVLPEQAAEFAAGLFSRTALIAYHSKYNQLVSDSYTKYELSSAPLLVNPAKRVLPKTSFGASGQAAAETAFIANGALLRAHENDAREADDSGLPEEVQAFLQGQDYGAEG